MRVPVLPHPCQHLLSLSFIFVFWRRWSIIFGYCFLFVSWWAVFELWLGFNKSHFMPSDTVYVICCSPHILLCEVSVQIFCLAHFGGCFLIVEFWELSVESGYKFFISYRICKYCLLVCGLFSHDSKSIFEKSDFFLLLA